MRSFGENAITTIISAGIDLQGKRFSTALNLWFFFALELCSFFFSQQTAEDMRFKNEN